jgi:hypothetical protein
MAHYAIVDANTMLVTQVFVGKDETDLTHDWEQYYAPAGTICKRTSYNGRIRKNYAGIGYLYDADRDAFIPPQPYPSWLLDEDTCLWQPPVPYPDDGNMYQWDEATQTWEPTEP